LIGVPVRNTDLSNDTRYK